MNEIEASLKEGVEQLTSIIEELPDTKNIEIEVRLGFFDDDGFDTNIHDDFYQKIIDSLMTNINWDRTEHNSYNDYHSNGLRLRISDDGSRQCIKKIRIASIDMTFDTTPFDIRISISKECPREIPRNFTESMSKHKIRYSFYHKAHQFDMTIVEETNNEITKKTYQAEIEISNLKNALKDRTPMYLAHSTLLKMQDIVDMCEKVSPDAKLQLLELKRF